jgi:hypothetical protein
VHDAFDPAEAFESGHGHYDRAWSLPARGEYRDSRRRCHPRDGDRRESPQGRTAHRSR